MAVTPENFTDKVRRARRMQRRNWTAEDERLWLQDHPEDEPLTDVAPAPPPVPPQLESTEEHEADLVPEVELYEKTEEDSTVDAVVDKIGIIEAYNRWAHKGTVTPGHKTEGIKVRCPDPSHADHNPSAWLNTDKDLWTCGGCGMEGGDKFDIAAWGLGFPVPGYKSGKKFPDLKRAMAAELGYIVATKTDRATKVVDPDASSSAPPEPSASSDDSPETDIEVDRDEPTASVTPLHVVSDPEYDSHLIIDWQEIAQEGGFLRAYMDACCKDDLPEEYHFWYGFVALSMALGRDVYLKDTKNVYGNIFTVVIGNTGSGKSMSLGYMMDVVRDALPYDTDPSNTGAKIISNAASGESLIDAFVEFDDATGDPRPKPVRGLMKFPELQTLAGKSRTDNSILKSVLIEFYDCDDAVTTKSRAHGTVEAHDAFGSCVTTTQRRLLRNLVSRDDANSGFLNRWVFVFGRPKKRVAYMGARVDLEEAKKQLRGTKSWAATKRTYGMELEGDARDVWIDFYDEELAPLTHDTSTEEDDDNDPLLARISLLFKKLILLIAVDRRELTPSAKTVKDALSLWPYIRATYRMVGINIVATEQTDLEEKIISSVVRHESKGKTPGPTRKELVNNLKHAYSRTDISAALKTLETCGDIVEVTANVGGRGPSRVMYVLG